MTVALSGKEVGKEVTEHFHDCVISSDDISIIVVPEHLFEVAEFLKNSHFAFDYLANLTSVDYLDYLEVVYNLVSLEHNHSHQLVLFIKSTNVRATSFLSKDPLSLNAAVFIFDTSSIRCWW